MVIRLNGVFLWEIRKEESGPGLRNERRKYAEKRPPNGICIVLGYVKTCKEQRLSIGSDGKASITRIHFIYQIGFSVIPVRSQE